MNEADGQLHTLSVLERLRDASKGLWGASSEAYFRVDELLRQLAHPNLHDIPRNLPFRVEMWDQSDQPIRWVIAASASVAVGHAAMDAANRELSRSALHIAEWDTRDLAASENSVVFRRQNSQSANPRRTQRPRATQPH